MDNSTAKKLRVFLVDGPLALYIYEGTEEEIIAAYQRLERAVKVAAAQIGAT